MEHALGILKIADAECPHLKETTLEEARERLRRNPGAVLVDVQKVHEGEAGHAVEAAPPGKGGYKAMSAAGWLLKQGSSSRKHLCRARPACADRLHAGPGTRPSRTSRPAPSSDRNHRR